MALQDAGVVLSPEPVDLSDVTITCSDEKKLLLHSQILAAKSKVYRTTFVKEAAGKDNKFTLEVTTVSSIEMVPFIQALYSHYMKGLVKRTNVESLFLLAHQYDVPSLEDVCEGFLKLLLQRGDKKLDPVHILSLAQRYKKPKLVKACSIKIAQSFVNEAKIFSTTASDAKYKEPSLFERNEWYEQYDSSTLRELLKTTLHEFALTWKKEKQEDGEREIRDADDYDEDYEESR